ncbi:MAG: hypothetical protein ACYST6_11070 [Planctomycetota bacterium]
MSNRISAGVTIKGQMRRQDDGLDGKLWTGARGFRIMAGRDANKSSKDKRKDGNHVSRRSIGFSSNRNYFTVTRVWG